MLAISGSGTRLEAPTSSQNRTLHRSTSANFIAAAGFYYYLRPVLAMYGQAEAAATPLIVSGPTRAVLFVLAAAIVVIVAARIEGKDSRGQKH